ncbi:mCpol domain-containing protein [Halodesulfovibrio spirochaetisodalis]|uniref:mCpol domain-containing protein n=1 Tax=Halodesulfovibrio spirochaetisodalis TaxID=1560234 RepID=UPI000833A3C8|nr:mCpol domain-containing protein [Halodesulfovibrio spirochaetisodalis]
MSSRYFYIDGDDIGLKIEKCFMENDEDGLARINKHVSTAIDNITEFLCSSSCEVIFSGADGIICKTESQLEPSEILDYIRETNSVLTFSVGTADSLCDAYVALRYAKSHGKNVAVLYEHSVFTILS